MASHSFTKHRKIRTLVALIVAGSFAISGCQSTDTDTAEGTTPTSSSASNDTRIITHAMGETEIKGEPKRVVALDRGLLDAAFAVGLNVVGYTKISGSDGIPEYFGEDGKKYGADAKDVGSLQEPSLEQISALKPDLILSAKVRHEELYPQLAKIAPTVFADKTGAVWKQSLELTGKAAGKEDVAAQKIKDYEERAKRIGDRVREKLGKNPSISVVRFVTGPTRLYKEASYSGVVLNDLGFKREGASAGQEFAQEVSDEEIGLLDADYIFVSTWSDKDGVSAATRERYEANPLWGKLQGEVHEVDDSIWMSAVGLYGANALIDDVADIFGVDKS